jgi:hypothetical protein
VEDGAAVDTPISGVDFAVDKPARGVEVLAGAVLAAVRLRTSFSSTFRFSWMASDSGVLVVSTAKCPRTTLIWASSSASVKSRAAAGESDPFSTSTVTLR